ncbi:MAG: DUF3306 domain-containing protein [Betaproteobacteria bacterium]|nr:DUF3306 domain-containing protein [Betaproteobacteria bacterium]
MTEQDEPFIARWSRRKIEAREARPESGQGGSESKPTPPAQDLRQPPSADAAAVPAKVLPPVDSLQGLASEYREFLHPEVDDGLRRAALKKLFSDPHFNTMDGLDVYIDDYSKPDPIPEAMLKTLEHAKGLLFDRNDEQNASENETVDTGENQTVAGAAEPGPTTGASTSPDLIENRTASAPEDPTAGGSVGATPPETSRTKP